MRMGSTAVNLKFAEHAPRKWAVGHHPLDRGTQHAIREASHNFIHNFDALAARVSRIALVGLLLALASGDRDLIHVHYDHEITRIEKRRVRGLMLAAQDSRDTTGEPAQNLAFSIDKHPVPNLRFMVNKGSCHSPTNLSQRSVSVNGDLFSFGKVLL